MMGLDQTATVHIEDAVTGAFSVTVKTGLACRLIVLSSDAAGTGGDRAELAASRRLAWEPGYTTMPEHAQVEVSGERWNVRAGTVTPIYRGVGAGRTLEHWHAEVMRA